MVEERIYAVPLQGAWKAPRWKRAPRAVRILKEFISRHMKPELIKIDQEINEQVWRKGIEKPPRRIRVRAVKDDEGTVTVYLHEGGR
ncbi:MAG: 50S ribosomal protein L31e [Candidatus Bathyarchaeota archaeon]|nr:MAG: 50S ribosomal protein L31e [Candidatus Bathyarchaeota archaeon]